MRRTFYATLIVLGVVVGLAAPATAGGGTPPPFAILTIDATCNTATGEYDVTFDLVNQDIYDADISVTTYEVDTDNPTPPTFSPDPLPDLGSSSATDSVPGTTVTIFMRITLTYESDPRDPDAPEGDPLVQGSLVLGADCTATPTPPPAVDDTTTTPPPAEPAVAVEAQPAFTG
ncbi:MAG TPA: hypothetical protein VMW08_19845 [Acidimicrobiales bacterium]|nr:hypothetical protein [Acidimicrobiales bacterium]